MRSTAAVLVFLLPAGAAPAADVAPDRAASTADAGQILAALDRNMVFESREARVTMRIKKESGTSDKELRMLSRGYDTAYTEFLSPARDKGTKYLKLEKNLWMWLPGVEKVVKISGHVLRQSLMGSDFSYEDMLESPDMSGRYEATLAGDETIDGHPCRVLTLKAKVAGVTYPERRVWIDAETSVPLKQHLYALTGKVLKEETFHDFKEYPDGDRTRLYPSRFVMKNLLQKGTETEIVLSEIQFGADVPDEIFSLSYLKRGD